MTRRLAPTLSILTPAFNEAVNLPRLYDRLRATLDHAGIAWEWLVIDDHSSDETFDAIGRLNAADQRVRGFRLARRSGSHVAIRCGVHHATGDAVAMIAADLEDPPEILPRLLDRWRQGFHIVWAVRGKRPNVNLIDRAFARLYYRMLRRMVGHALPSSGSDCFLIDRAVARALDRCHERHASVFALIGWLGFRQTHEVYDKGTRVHGSSSWSLARKLGLFTDSVVGFSPALMAWTWVAGIAVLAAAIAVLLLGPISPSVQTTLVLLADGLVLMAIWTLGLYVWRALEDSRGRPLWVLEDTVGQAAAEIAAPDAVREGVAG